MPGYSTDDIWGSSPEEPIGFTSGQVWGNEPTTVEEVVVTAQRRTPPDNSAAGNVKSFLRGGLQGASFGFADEIGAGIRALGPETYDEALKHERDIYARAKEDNPLAYGAGDVGGSAATMFIPGLGPAKLVSLLGRGATTAKELSTLGRIGEAARAGAIGGGLRAAGDSEEISDMPLNAAGGAALGGVLGAPFGAGAPVRQTGQFVHNATDTILAGAGGGGKGLGGLKNLPGEVFDVWKNGATSVSPQDVFNGRIAAAAYSAGNSIPLEIKSRLAGWGMQAGGHALDKIPPGFVAQQLSHGIWGDSISSEDIIKDRLGMGQKPYGMIGGAYYDRGY